MQYYTSTARTAGVEWITPFSATGGVVIANTGAITVNADKTVNTSLNINSGSTLLQNGGNITVGNTFTVNGTHNAGTNTVTGTGTYTLASGATLITANSGGINGSITTTNKSLSTSANYEFNGAAQTTAGLPATVNNLTFSGTGSKTLTSDVQANGNLNINSNATLEIPLANKVTAGTAFTLAGNLLLSKTLTGASQVISTNTPNTTGGKVRVKVTFADYSKWQFVSFPFVVDAIKQSDGIADAVIYGGSGTEVGSNLGIVTYNAQSRADGGTSNWTKVTALPLAAGTGYAMWGSDGDGAPLESVDLIFESNSPASSAFSSTTTRALTYTTGSSGNTQNYGWNFISHPLSAKAYGKMSTGEFLYSYNSLSDTYNTVDANTGITTSNVANFDGYFIKTAAARTMNFSTVSMPSNVKSSVLTDKVVLNLVGASATYSTAINLNEASTTAYDQLYDAPYTPGMSSSTPQIYTLIGTDRFAINSVPDESVVPVGFRVPAAGTYSFTWDAQLSNIKATLYDIVADQTVDLTEAGSYTFQTTASGRFNDRFLINFGQRVITGLDNETTVPFFVSTQSGKIVIDGLTKNSAIQLMDATGRMISSQTVHTNSVTIGVPSSGLYLLNVNDKTMKLVVNSK